MEGQGRQVGGLALCLLGVIGVCLACGLPMWRETSFVGANIVTAQSVWDGLWLHCVVQATGQMQCKKHTTALTMTSDIQAGRALTLLSILTGLLGFIVTILSGGVANCSGEPPDNPSAQSTSSSKTKVALLGGALCVLSGILCLVSVSWSAGNTISIYNDPLVVPAMKREVGSSIYIGWASSLLLLLGGALICFVCSGENSSDPSQRVYMPYSYSSQSQFSETPSRTATVRSDGFSDGRPYNHNTPNRTAEHALHVYDRNSLNKAQEGVYNPAPGSRRESVHSSFDRNAHVRGNQGATLSMENQANQAVLVHDIPSRATTALNYYNTSDVDRPGHL